MSGPTWLPPRTLGSPERPAAQMSHAGSAYYRPPKKGPSDQRPKYSVYDQNGATGGHSVPMRYMATGPSGENIFKVSHKLLSMACFVQLCHVCIQSEEMKAQHIHCKSYYLE